MKSNKKAEAQARKDIGQFIGPSDHAKDDYFDVYDVRLKHIFSNEINPIKIN